MVNPSEECIRNVLSRLLGLIWKIIIVFSGLCNFLMNLMYLRETFSVRKWLHLTLADNHLFMCCLQSKSNAARSQTWGSLDILMTVILKPVVFNLVSDHFPANITFCHIPSPWNGTCDIFVRTFHAVLYLYVLYIPTLAKKIGTYTDRLAECFFFLFPYE